MKKIFIKLILILLVSSNYLFSAAAPEDIWWKNSNLCLSVYENNLSYIKGSLKHGADINAVINQKIVDECVYNKIEINN